MDTTTPTISAPVISGQQGSNGWFTGPVTVTFGCSDYFLASCSPSSPVVLGSDGANQGFTIAAKDSSGNTATQTVGGINIDQTVPSNIAGTPDRGTDSNGWYNHGLNVGFKATFGPSSGSCTAGSYSGPDTGSASVATTCTSGAGLSAQGSFGPFQYDGTAPSNVAGAAARGADSNGWYNAPVGIGFTGTFSASGGSCTSTTYSAPNSAAATQAGSCTSGAGLTTNGSFGPFEYDSAAPTVAIAAARPADSNGWYNHAVSFSFSDTTNPQVSGSSCDAAANYSGPDSATASVTGSCTSGAGLKGSNRNSFQYDGSKPVVTATPDRAANGAGWYSAPVTITFSGTALSGIASCDPAAVYGGPDNGSVSVSGNCTSNAGNTGSGSFGLKYDATKPGLNPTITPNPVVIGGTAAGNPNATDNLSGIASASCTAISTGKLGSISTTCTATDNAGNTATATANGNVVGITLSNASSSGSNCGYSIKAGIPFSCTYTYTVSEDAATDTGTIKAQFGTTGNPGIAGTASNGGESWNIVTAKPNNNNFVVTATGTAPKLTVVNGTISVTLGGMPKCSADSTVQLIDGFSVGGTFAGQNFNTPKNSPVSLTCQA